MIPNSVVRTIPAMPTEEESSKAIELWILEHACINRMDKVIDEIVNKCKDDATFSILKSDMVSSFGRQGVHLTILLRKLVHEITALERDMNLVPLVCNFDEDLSSKTALLVEEMYAEIHFIPLKLFMNIVSRLKMLVVIHKMMKREDHQKIWETMSCFFPRANETLKNTTQEQYKLTSSTLAEKVIEGYSCCRKYILQFLVMNGEKKEKYLTDTLPDDLRDFALASLKYVEETRNIVSEKLPPSPLDQVLQGASEDLRYSDDPNIQILLRTITPGITEDRLLNLLEELKKVPSNPATKSESSELENDFREKVSLDRTEVKERARSKETTPKKSLKVALRATPKSLADRYFATETKENDSLAKKIKDHPKKKKREEKTSPKNAPEAKETKKTKSQIKQLKGEEKISPNKATEGKENLPAKKTRTKKTEIKEMSPKNDTEETKLPVKKSQKQPKKRQGKEGERDEKPTSKSPRNDDIVRPKMCPCQISLRYKKKISQKGKNYKIFS